MLMFAIPSLKTVIQNNLIAPYDLCGAHNIFLRNTLAAE